MRHLLIAALFLLPAIAAAEDCFPTPSQTIGTHYDPSKATYQPGDLGKGFTIQGRVLSALDCQPIPGIKIIHWQAGENGQYLDRLYAWRKSDEDGAYRFETEWPALRPPHIHFQIEITGYHPLATQWIARSAEAKSGVATFDLVLQPR